MSKYTKGSREQFSRRRNPDEVVPARRAIRLMCSECMGFVRSEVSGCTAPGCWLYPWRSGTPEEAKSSRPGGVSPRFKRAVRCDSAPQTREEEPQALPGTEPGKGG